jgi:hypothetical protein
MSCSAFILAPWQTAAEWLECSILNKEFIFRLR